MHSEDYKKLQEERFSKNVGTSLMEIILMSQMPFIFMFFSLLTVPMICKSTSFIYPILEFVFIFIPQILLLTIFSRYLNELYIFYIISSCIVALYLYFTVNYKNLRSIFKKVTISDTRLPCVTSFRSAVNSLSIICILAADFECFPRKYLKTDTHGYGLMDTGVGLYVISNSFTNSHFIKRSNEKRIKIIPIVRSTLKKVLPLLAIGVGRYIATAAVQYHQNVSEYGVHWNFFISLSVLAIFNELLVLFVSRIDIIYVLIAMLLSVHEYLLYAGVKSWVNDDPSRVGFIASNKEGICSLLGYEIIYLSGLALRYFLPRKGDDFKKYFKIINKLILAFLFCTFATILSEHTFGVSRKLANCGYIFWIVSLSLVSFVHVIFQEFLLYILNVPMLKNKKLIKVIPMIMEAINYNGLVFFLIGNLLTGIINICIPTLTVNSVYSILILISYMFLCCYLVIHLYKKNIRLR